MNEQRIGRWKLTAESGKPLTSIHVNGEIRSAA